MVTGSYSKIENVLTDAEPPRLDPIIFGPEPAHNWCYFFEKAELAVQNEDWDVVMDLAEEVGAQKMHPNERLEWMPFLQAYAVLGNEEDFSDTMAKMTSVTASSSVASYDVPKVNAYNRRQACNVLTSMQETGQDFPSQMQDLIDITVCK